MSASPRNDEASILSRAVDASHAWTPSVAQAILALALFPADRDRMNELAARSRDGTLSADEELEIESYRRACRLLDLMKAKARRSLRARSTRFGENEDVDVGVGVNVVVSVDSDGDCDVPPRR